MLISASFDYATLRVVPRVERQEFINIGVIVLCRERRFLAARVAIDEVRLLALAPSIDLETVRLHALAAVRISEGDPSAGPIAALTQSERFHWLTNPRSTIIQPSPVHTGLCDDPAEVVIRLFAQLVA